jgi:putative flippase GtrA
LVFISPYIGFSNTFAWATGWFVSSISAHFVHRYFTFDGRKDVRHTTIGALSVYAFGLVGSTLTFDSLLILSNLPIRLIFFINVCCWDQLIPNTRFILSAKLNFGNSETNPSL